MSAAALPAAAGDIVYVPLGGESKIVLVDAKEDVLVGTIEGLPAVHGLAATPDGRFLIAGSYDEREPGSDLPAKPTNVSEDEHAAHHAKPSGEPKETGTAVSTVSIVSTAERAVVRRIDVPGAVHHVSVSPDGRWAVVSHPTADAISVIDLGTHAVLITVKTGPLPNYTAFSPDGRRVYVSNAGNDTVSVLDTAGWTVERTLAVGSSPEHIVLSEDGSALYVNNVDDGTVTVLDLRSGAAAKTIPVGEVLHGIDLSDDGRTLFVSAMGDDVLAAINLKTGEVRKTTLAPAPYHLSAVRGAGKLYVSSADEPKIWIVDQKSLAVLGEIMIGGKGHQMVQAADE
jgi:YVTN family beta-propeller protein